jgi:RNA polymerase sigma factor (sigma-70 family)
VDGVVRPLPPATDLTAYRVIQESLTNVRKHAGTAATTIRVSYQPRARFLATRDDEEERPAAEALSALTEREREIVALVAAGLSNDEIAGRLVVSPATVKTHVNRAMAKIGAHDRARLVIAAYQAGLVRGG